MPFAPLIISTASLIESPSTRRFAQNLRCSGTPLVSLKISRLSASSSISNSTPADATVFSKRARESGRLSPAEHDFFFPGRRSSRVVITALQRTGRFVKNSPNSSISSSGRVSRLSRAKSIPILDSVPEPSLNTSDRRSSSCRALWSSPTMVSIVVSCALCRNASHRLRNRDESRTNRGAPCKNPECVSLSGRKPL